MSLQKLRKFKKFKKNKRKRHVETMFQLQSKKKYPYYFKSVLNNIENNKNNFFLNKNTFYIKAVNSGFININTLKSVFRIYKWFIKSLKLEDKMDLKLLIFPDIAFTSKPKDVRMGKGKGPVVKNLALYKEGQNIILLKVKNLKKYKNLVIELLNKIKFKLPNKFIITKKTW